MKDNNYSILTKVKTIGPNSKWIICSNLQWLLLVVLVSGAWYCQERRPLAFDYEVVKIDDCEYLLGNREITHKGNCSSSVHKNGLK